MQPSVDALGDGLRGHDDDMPVLVDQGLHLRQRLVQRSLVEVPQHDGGQGPFVLWWQRHVGAGHGNGSWHAQLPVSRLSAGRHYSGTPS